MSSKERASSDLAECLAEGDALDTFLSLPEDARRRFEDWISMAIDDSAYWRRIEILVIAMRFAPRIEGSKGTGRVSGPPES